MSPLVQIPNVSATQLIGPSRIPLKSGILTLTLHPPTPTTTTKLLLNIDTLTIPLSADSTVGAKNSLTYLFAFPLSAVETGFVEITLPQSADDETTEVSKAATEFEGVLVGYGFLTAGLLADAEDMTWAVKEAAGRAAGKVSAKTDARVESGEGDGDGGTRFSERTHRVVGGAVEGSGKLAEVSGRISSAVSGATFEAGKWVGGQLGGGGLPVGQDSEGGGDRDGGESLPREAAEQALGAAGVAASGLGQGYGVLSIAVVYPES